MPFDSWLRVHIRMGGRIVKVAPCSMVVPGTLAEWSRWTGIRFAESGDLVVPGALAPVHVSREQDHAVYIEPNVWVHHRLAKPGDLTVKGRVLKLGRQLAVCEAEIFNLGGELIASGRGAYVTAEKPK